MLICVLSLLTKLRGSTVCPNVLLCTKSLYAFCTFSALKAAAAKFVDDLNKQVEKVEDTKNFFLDCGFHAVDISPCADGRLKCITRYILRLPLSSFTRRKAYAGALFDVETDVRHWAETELRRYREGVPTTSDAGTRYLKIAVYHFSSSDSSHEGCAAHGSNDKIAIDAALERLEQFKEAIEIDGAMKSPSKSSAGSIPDIQNKAEKRKPIEDSCDSPNTKAIKCDAQTELQEGSKQVSSENLGKNSHEAVKSALESPVPKNLPKEATGRLDFLSHFFLINTQVCKACLFSNGSVYH